MIGQVQPGIRPGNKKNHKTYYAGNFCHDVLIIFMVDKDSFFQINRDLE